MKQLHKSRERATFYSDKRPKKFPCVEVLRMVGGGLVGEYEVVDFVYAPNHIKNKVDYLLGYMEGLNDS